MIGYYVLKHLQNTEIKCFCLSGKFKKKMYRTVDKERLKYMLSFPAFASLKVLTHFGKEEAHEEIHYHGRYILDNNYVKN